MIISPSGTFCAYKKAVSQQDNASATAFVSFMGWDIRAKKKAATLVNWRPRPDMQCSEDSLAYAPPEKWHSTALGDCTRSADLNLSIQTSLNWMFARCDCRTNRHVRFL